MCFVHNGVHLFDIWTSKCAPRLMCFVHFDFEMCFAPQWRALFQHLKFQKCSEPFRTYTFGFEICFAPQPRALFEHRNFEKCSEHEVLCACWLQNVLRATTTCNVSSLISPAGSAPAALASLLFDPQPQNIGKTQCFATFLPFRAPGSSFLWLSLLFFFFFVFFFSVFVFVFFFSSSSYPLKQSKHENSPRSICKWIQGDTRRGCYIPML